MRGVSAVERWRKLTNDLNEPAFVHSIRFMLEGHRLDVRVGLQWHLRTAFLRKKSSKAVFARDD